MSPQPEKRAQKEESSCSRASCEAGAKPSAVCTVICGLVTELVTVVFKVANTATKPQIKEAVEAIFGVSVMGVNTINMKGKTKRWKGKAYKRVDQKKAVVTLKDGDSIDVTSGI